MRKARPDASGPPTRQAATPIAFVQAVVQGFERYGADPSEALRQAQIAPSLLRRPEARVTAAQFEVLCGTAMQQLDDEALGWFSRRLPWGSYGLLCRASLGAPNLGVALKRWCRHHRLLTEDIVLELSDDGQVATLAIDEQRELGALREFCLLTSLRYLHGFACWAVDSRIGLHQAAFPFAAPPHAAVYPLLFPGAVGFDAARAGFSFDAHYLALPLRRDERALRTMLQHALPLTVLQYRRDRLLVQRVRERLRDSAAEALHAQGLAHSLNVSLRTLHRHLRQEGASVQALKDEVRCNRAQELLGRTRQPVKQIAHQLGFRSEKSFARAFRLWTGATPSGWRLAAACHQTEPTSELASGRMQLLPASPNGKSMRDFEDSTLWRISAYERMRVERSSSVFAQLGENTMLPTTMLADLRHLEARRESSDILENLAACMRHRQSALICLQYEELVWPVTVFPGELVYHSPRDMALAAADGLATLKVLSCDAPGVRPPGHWMHERVGRMEHYHALKPLLWNLALNGPRNELLAEIAGNAAYRVTLSREDRLLAPGALGPAADRLRRETVSLRDIAKWPGMSTDRACRLLNALYLTSALMVMRSHAAARPERDLLSRLLRRDKPRR